MLMNSSSALSSTYSLDNSYSESEENPNLHHPLKKFWKWTKRPNQVPNGRLLLATIVLAVVTFGTAIGLKRFIDQVTYDLCLNRVEGRQANISNFEDLYVTVIDINPESAAVIQGLRERMMERTPPLHKGDC